jgi:hypothetical protein
MPKEPTRRYSMEIKDVDEKSVLFTAADWTDEEARVAAAQIMRLAGLPADNCLTAPARGKDTADAPSPASQLSPLTPRRV